MGHEIAGTVVEVGPLLKGFHVGDRVAVTQRVSCGFCPACRSGRDNVCVAGAGFYGEQISGGYGEFVVASARNAVIVPDNIPLPTASVLSCALGTGFHALRQGALGIGETVVITGASGGVGIHAVQLAQLLGLRIIAITSSPGKAAALEKAGASHVIVTNDFSFHDQVKSLTDGEGADAVLEIAGAPTFRSSLRSVRAGGRVVLIGNMQPGNVPLNPALPILKEISLIGSGHATVEDLRRIVRLVAAGTIKPLITNEMPLEAAPDAHRMLEARQAAGRIVLLHETAG
jgi:D-arabinose 1-dehydrogenase-like Zn-dependent alcohol dehydrogenase